MINKKARYSVSFSSATEPLTFSVYSSVNIVFITIQKKL